MTSLSSKGLQIKRINLQVAAEFTFMQVPVRAYSCVNLSVSSQRSLVRLEDFYRHITTDNQALESDVMVLYSQTVY